MLVDSGRRLLHCGVFLSSVEIRLALEFCVSHIVQMLSFVRTFIYQTRALGSQSRADRILITFIVIEQV